MANGLFAGGNGTETNPYLIEDADDLNAMRHHLSSHFKLINDINLGVAPYSEGEGWNPIDNFIGTLNGNYHTIYNLYINRPVRNNIGLFGYAEQNRHQTTFRVRDLALDNVNITGFEQVGGIIGYYHCKGAGEGSYWNSNYEHMIVRTQVAGKITAYSTAGGVIGYFQDNESCHRSYGGKNVWLMEDVVSMCNIYVSDASTSYGGGVVGRFAFNDWIGWNTAKIHGCLSFCTLKKSNGAKNLSSFYGTNYWTGEDENCIADIDLLEGCSANSSTKTASTQKLKSGDYDYLAYWYNRQVDGRNVYRVEKGRYPQLSFVNRNCYFVRTKSGDYLTYEPMSKKWEKQFDIATIPSTVNVRALGMREISSLDATVWDMLDKEEFEIINVLPQRNVMSTKRLTEKMKVDSKVEGERIVHRKTFNFDDYGNEIMNISPVI